MEQRSNCPLVCVLFRDQGSNVPCFGPLDHQRSPSPGILRLQLVTIWWQWMFFLHVSLITDVQSFYFPFCGTSVYDFAPSAQISFLLLSSVQLFSHIWLFATPWTAAHQASLPITSSQSLLKLISIKSVMQSNHLFLSHPLLLLPSIFPTIRVFPNESVLHIRWPKYWEFQLQHQSFQWVFRPDFLFFLN